MQEIIWGYWLVSCISLFILLILFFQMQRGKRSIYFWMIVKTTAAIGTGLLSYDLNWFDQLAIRGHSIQLFALYVDWLVTTPLSLVVLLHCFYNDLPRSQWMKISTLIIGLDILMVGLGFLSEWFQANDLMHWIAFGLSGLMMVGIVFNLNRISVFLFNLGRTSVAITFQHRFKRLMSFWFIFPVIWIASPLGFAWIPMNEAKGLFWFVNGVTKLIFFIDVLKNVIVTEARDKRELV